MKYLLVTIFFSIMCMHGFSQTCIVIRKVKNEITIGADSRQIRFRKNILTNKIEPIPESMCKIFIANKYCFAIAGFQPDFLITSAMESIKKGGTLAEIGDRCQTSILPELMYSIVDTKEQKPEEFKKMFHVGAVVSGILIFGHENDSAKILYVRFIMRENHLDSKQDFVESEEAMGHTKDIKDILHDKTTWTKGSIEGIKKLINIEIKKQPVHVAAPIDILKLTKYGTKWIAKKQICN